MKLVKIPTYAEAAEYLHGEEIDELRSVLVNGEVPWCGQCCMAMVSGRDMETVLEKSLMGGACNEQDIRNGLRELGVKENEQSATRIVLLNYTHDKNISHWIVEHGPIVLDPIGLCLIKTAYYNGAGCNAFPISWIGVDIRRQ